MSVPMVCMVVCKGPLGQHCRFWTRSQLRDGFPEPMTSAALVLGTAAPREEHRMLQSYIQEGQAENFEMKGPGYFESGWK